MARVAAGEAQAAFFMNPTKVEEVLSVCEAGFVLPQKSTYFQPKLATGLVMYGLDGPAPTVGRAAVDDGRRRSRPTRSCGGACASTSRRAARG